eukprot:Hpha_TRINITY_DN11571_c0_g1::TRINITY_DN11571_c0_g1_i1::g.32117::m.32117
MNCTHRVRGTHGPAQVVQRKPRNAEEAVKGPEQERVDATYRDAAATLFLAEVAECKGSSGQEARDVVPYLFSAHFEHLEERWEGTDLTTTAPFRFPQQTLSITAPPPSFNWLRRRPCIQRILGAEVPG